MVKRVLLSFQEDGKNGGPYHSHKRIMNSDLSEECDFIPLVVPMFAKLINPIEARRFISFIRGSEAEIFHFSGLQSEGFHVLLLARIAENVKTVCAIRGSLKTWFQ